MTQYFNMLYMYGNVMADIRIFKLFNCQIFPSISLYDLNLRGWKMGIACNMSFYIDYPCVKVYKNQSKSRQNMAETEIFRTTSWHSHRETVGLLYAAFFEQRHTY